MPGTTLARRLRLRLAVGLACLLAAAMAAAPLRGEPDASPLKPEQEQKRKERNRLVVEANRLQQQGKPAEAIAAAEKALALEREVFGAVRGDMVGWLEWLAGMYQQREDFAAARQARQELLVVRTWLHGGKDWRVTDARLALADVERLAAMTPAQRQRLYEARRLNEEMVTLWQQGRNREAMQRARRALRVTKQELGEQHPRYAGSLSHLARLYQTLGEYDRAEPLLRQATEIRKGALGERHPLYAASLNNLALLYDSMGDYAKAEALFRQALQTAKQALGEEHPDYATGLDNLARLYQHMGDYAQAESLYQQALAIRKQALAQNHPDYATGLNNLATLYDSMGDYAKAEPLLRQALTVTRRALGEKHPDYATCLNNLAGLYGSLGDYVRAEPLYRQALQIDKQTLGEQHPSYAGSLNNLAELYHSKGEYARAEPLLRQALQIYKQALGEQHPAYTAGASNLALLYWSEAAGLQLLLPPAASPHHLAAPYACATELQRAQRLLRRALEISRANLELAAAAQSQRQQLAMLGRLRCQLDSYLSLAPQVPLDAAAQYREVLAWKGAVGRRQRVQRLARKDSRLAEDFAALDRVGARLAALALAAPDPRGLQHRRRQMHELTDEKERLEAELAGRSAAFRAGKELQHLEPGRLQAALPAEAGLIDFLEYVHYSPAPWKGGGWRRERRLVAFVVRRDRLVRVDLGPAGPVQQAVQNWRQTLQRRFRTGGDAQLGAVVRRLVWRPLEAHLKGARLVLVSPDGPLARMPLAALPGSRKDSYLLEEWAVAVVPVPQLLPELLAPHGDEGKAEPSLLVVGDVRYDAADGGAVVADSRSAPRGGARMQWKALEGTRAEVAAIKDSFQDRFPAARMTDLRRSRATEAAVRQEAPAHRYLHLATHGFFAPRELRCALADVSRAGNEDAGNLFGRRGVEGFHPGLLSGLVLAGANRPVEADKDDGILTALEVESLDLSAVELAVLSACETGLGEVAGGEGVLGLQRAFQLAGARSVVASLWQVDDRATRELMVRFYENLWDKKLPRLEALRQAQLWMLREGAGRGMVDVRVPKERLPVEDGRLAPYYWAAFSLSGEWR
jgi:CHAT domain-containing protein/Flp pilus assembly protein TadD